MKRSAILLTLILLANAVSNAQSNTLAQESDSIVVITSPDTVKISNTKNYVTVEVCKNKGEKYKLHRELSAQGVTILSEKSSELNFKIPFIGKKANKNRENGNSKSGNVDFYILRPQYGMGLVTATDQADGMDVRMANCGMEFTLNNLFGWQYRPVKNTALTLDFGVNWRNYRMKGENRFLKEDNKLIVTPYPDGADIKFSRIKIFSMTLELMLSQQLAKRVSIGAGPVVNFNTHGSIKTRYELDGKGRKETSNNINQNAVTIDYKAYIKVKPISLYVKYSPMNMLDTDYGPKFRSLSAGLLLDFHHD